MMRDKDLGATICCWLPRGKMDRQRRHRGSRGMLPSQKYPHSRHKVTLFTLGRRARGVRWRSTEPHKQPAFGRRLASAGNSAGSVVLARVT